MADQDIFEHLKQLFASVRAALRPILPKRLRGDTPVVPVVRLSGVIGISTPLQPGLTLANVARPLERAFAHAQGAGGRAGDQFARRLAGAIASDLPPHPRNSPPRTNGR